MAGIAGLIPVAMQIWQSIKQGQQANQLSSQYERPNMQIPQGYLNALDISKNQALQTGLPGQNIIEERLQETGANTLSAVKEAATSPWEVISGAQRIGENVMEKQKNIGVAGAEYQADATRQLADVFQGLSKLQQEQFMYNDYMPYMNAMNTTRALREASTKNLYSGSSNLAGMISYNPDMFKGLFGNNNEMDVLMAKQSGIDSGIDSRISFNPEKFIPKEY